MRKIGNNKQKWNTVIHWLRDSHWHLLLVFQLFLPFRKNVRSRCWWSFPPHSYSMPPLIACIRTIPIKKFTYRMHEFRECGGISVKHELPIITKSLFIHVLSMPLWRELYKEFFKFENVWSSGYLGGLPSFLRSLRFDSILGFCNSKRCSSFSILIKFCEGWSSYKLTL